ncbi:MAG TPA: hypothetical protein VF595_04865 [Tepidisphaeraceae bacterium]
MIDRLRKLLETNVGKFIGMAVVALAVVYAIYTVVSLGGSSEAGRLSSDRVFIDAETGKSFNYTIKIGDSLPVKSPFSGKNTGYEADACYWTKDGKPKTEPTYVLVKERIGQRGPTFCPDCGRLVVGLNPSPGPGVTAPPTAAEFKQRSR